MHCKTMLKTDELAQLLNKISDGDEMAFSQLLRQYDDFIYSRALMLTKSNLTAKELTQDIFIKLWEKRVQLKLVEKFESYLFILLRNEFISALRKNVSVISHGYDSQGIEKVSQPDEILMSKNLNDVVLKGIEMLPPMRKNVFRLSRLEGYSYEEIATELNISRNTVKDHISLSLKFLKKYMSHYILIIMTALSFFQRIF